MLYVNDGSHANLLPGPIVLAPFFAILLVGLELFWRAQTSF